LALIYIEDPNLMRQTKFYKRLYRFRHPFDIIKGTGCQILQHMKEYNMILARLYYYHCPLPSLPFIVMGENTIWRLRQLWRLMGI